MEAARGTCSPGFMATSPTLNRMDFIQQNSRAGVQNPTIHADWWGFFRVHVQA